VELARCPQLVAFVATPAAQFAATPQIAQPAIPGYRAVNAMAVLPAAPERLLYRKPYAVRLAHHSNVASHALPQADPLNLRAARQPEPPQWIVLTSWQVQAPQTKSGRVADYDTGDDETVGQTGPGSGNQVTVTRLILRVAPANTAPESTAGSVGSPATTHANPAQPSADAKPGSSSTPKLFTLPTAVPIGDGWLVIQL
jgi:hypothetical protein